MMLTRKQWVAVVDAYSGGRHLIPAIQALGYPVVHVESAEPPAVFRSDSVRACEAADETIRFDGDLAKLVHRLGETRVSAVLVGSEGGVLLADKLANELQVAVRNPLQHSTARRDKFAMQQRLRDVGLAHIATERMRDRRELLAWLERREAYPVVVKPPRSAGTDGVAICGSRQEAVAALERVLAANDIFGDVNQYAVCQEYVDGEEHVINGVASRGQYWFSEGWHSTKVLRHDHPVYDVQYLIAPGDEEFGLLGTYVADVCRALGIVNGAFHAEVMVTGGGPVLIEIAARLAGGADPYVTELCVGQSQLDALVTATLQPDRFWLEVQASEPARRRGHAAYVYLVAERDGWVHDPDPQTFFEVPGVISVDYHHDAGDFQPETRDLLTAPGVVIVTAESAEDLAESVRRVRAVEQDFFARVIRRVRPESGTTRP